MIMGVIMFFPPTQAMSSGVDDDPFFHDEAVI